MKLIVATWTTTICLLTLRPPCLAQAPDSTQSLRASFQSLAPELSTQHLWDSTGPDAAQKHSLEQLGKLADEVMKQPDFAPAMLAMLDDYKERDGYQRQKLMRAIFASPRYTVADVPFLKDVFLASITFHYDTYPARVRGWLTPSAIRFDLANMILTLKGQGTVIGNPDLDLFSTNPTAWLAKYAP